MRTLLRILVNAFALWLTTLIVGGNADVGVWVVPLSDDTWGRVWTYLLIALVFGLINSVLGPIVRIVSLPLYILTLGLFGLIVNALLLLLVVWLSSLMGFGLAVGGFWWGVLAALVLSLLSSIINAVLGTNRRRRRAL